jgi:electron transfer flavoprotein alpha subunit
MILIVADHNGSKLDKITSELVSAARGVASESPIAILVLGYQISSVAAEASHLTQQVLVADRPELQQYDPEVWTAAVSQVAREGEVDFIFIAGNRAGREYSARVAARLGGALLEDIFAVESREGAVTAHRYTYLARVTEKVGTDLKPVVATVKAGAFPSASLNTEVGEQYDVDLDLPIPRVRITSRSSARSTRVPLEDADIVVSGGRGVGSAEGFAQFVEALADQLGAAVGATRAIVDAGWRPYSEQVGQTGKTVQPKAYIAVGISGAVQHLSGMNKSQYIIAINKDAECPMIRTCDCGIVGNVAEVVPALIETLRK